MVDDVHIHGLKHGEIYPKLDEMISEIKNSYEIQGILHVCIIDDLSDGPNLMAEIKRLFIKNLDFKTYNVIKITRGVLKILEPPKYNNELKAMIAHECSHLYNKDSRVAQTILIIYLIPGFAIVGFAVILNILNINNLSNSNIALTVFPLLMFISLFIIGLRNANWKRRKMETRCDSDAVFITQNPESLQKALKKLYVDFDVRKNVVNNKGTLSIALKSIIYYFIGTSHPSNQERIRDIESLKIK